MGGNFSPLKQSAMLMETETMESIMFRSHCQGFQIVDSKSGLQQATVKTQVYLCREKEQELEAWLWLQDK